MMTSSQMTYRSKAIPKKISTMCFTQTGKLIPKFRWNLFCFALLRQGSFQCAFKAGLNSNPPD